MKRIVFLSLFSFYIVIGYSQVPEKYYNDAIGLKGDSLKVALHNIIKEHTVISYKGIWACYPHSDSKPDNTVWDIYSDIPEGNSPYTYTFFDNQCGNYSSEGDCYNREHLVPKSWFNDASPMASDLNHIFPTDGFVNNRRGNYPFGEVKSASWTSKNGSKLGPCSLTNYSGTVFEPIDEYKGDIARVFFYMAIRYMDQNLGQQANSIFNQATIDPWALDMFIRWHNQDTVSQKEINRNRVVDSLQHNRNPFIDYPQLVELIFGNKKNSRFYPNGDDPGSEPEDTTAIRNYTEANNFVLYPNPASNKVYIRNVDRQPIQILALSLFDMQGRILLYTDLQIDNLTWTCENTLPIDFSAFKSGCYFIKIDTPKGSETHKVIVR